MIPYSQLHFNRFKDERKLFAKLAAQCAQLSSSESTLFDQATYGSSPIYASQAVDDVILFSQISDKEESRIYGAPDKINSLGETSHQIKSKVV